MTKDEMIYLVALVSLYALHEFLLKRLLWKSSQEHNEGGWMATKKGALLLAVLVIGTSGFISLVLAIGYVVIAAVYAIDEYVGTRGTNEGIARRSLETFILKQTIMALLLGVAWRAAMPITVHEWYANSEGVVLAGSGKFGDVLREKFVFVLAVVTAYLFIIDGGTRIVRGILGKFPGLYNKVLQTLNPRGGSTAAATELEENVGEWIGILERIITLTLILTDNFTAIAFVLTAKSIARFKAIEDSKDFAEYYLLGTSGSMIAALGAGIVVRLIFGL